ncbi:hypothetical protein GCM10011521_19890 [Arenimonas soli]|uniref:Uncharacterized protein n=2 Tax=Arenimonas soli TaxID=2269504 RepID=A0ABQ1HLQ5_9GAMM|nr:hypothetical protein GCM10011521_19890 [Arenimonas soli]
MSEWTAAAGQDARPFPFGAGPQRPAGVTLEIAMNQKQENRSVFAVDNLAQLEDALTAARDAGIADKDIALVARHDIELELDPDASDPDEHGRVRGLLAGLSAVAVPTLGVSLAGAGMLNLLGSNLAGWTGHAAGDHANDDVRERYQALVESGVLLVVVQADSAERHAAAHAAMVTAGARPLDDGQD